MPIFRVRPGMRHGVGKRYGPGDLVTLSAEEAAAFADKLEPVDDAPALGAVVDGVESPAPEPEPAQRRGRAR